MKRLHRPPLLLALVFLMVLVGCSQPVGPSTEGPGPLSQEETPSSGKLAADKSFIEYANLTQVEASYLKQLTRGNGLTVAIRELDYVYMPTDDGSINGFNYRLLWAFSQETGVNLELKFIDSFSQYFETNGTVPEHVQTDATIIYIPDLLQEVDLYCDVLTVVPWREKLFRFVKTVPVREMLVVREGEELTSLHQLDGKIVTNIKDTSYEATLRGLQRDLNIDFDYVYVEADFMQQEKLLNGEVDVVIQDSLVALNEIKKHEGLSMTIPASPLQHLGWGVKHDDVILGDILDKFIIYAQDSGLLEEIWQDEYGITMFEYLQLMSGE